MSVERAATGENLCRSWPAGFKLVLAVAVIVAAGLLPEELWPATAFLGVFVAALHALAGTSPRWLVRRTLQFLPMVIEALKGWKAGHPLDPATNVGALVDTQQLNTVLSYIDAGHADGAKLVAGGKRTLEETGGTYVAVAWKA